jgi:chlorobactene glucosyltransferase
MFLAVLAVLSLSNLVGIPRLGTGKRRLPKGAATPRVSILVPARNEEEHIADCVQSLLAQDYPAFEVLVLDDESDDGTRSALEPLCGNPRLRVLAGAPVPEGWMGKNWACHQLAQRARGELFLFTDADTRHAPRALAAAVAMLQAEGVGFLSAMPRQEMRTWGELALVPILPWSQHTFFPVALVRRLPFPRLATAVGQFMLVRRDAYAASGGYERIRASAVDDWDLVRAVAAGGAHWILCDGSRVVAARMYASFRGAVDGFSKNLYARFDYNWPFLAFVWLWLLWTTWQPPVVLVVRAAGGPVSAESAVWAAVATGLNLLLWTIADLRFGTSAWHVLAHPITVLVSACVAARSVAWRALRRGAWKDRPLWGRGRTSGRR